MSRELLPERLRPRALRFDFLATGKRSELRNRGNIRNVRTREHGLAKTGERRGVGSAGQGLVSEVA